uniref:Uncharacterized protein n=1 Tax=Esox lucius TaxID=8010 RepID=A0AAY5KLK0_ESOLU
MLLLYCALLHLPSCLLGSPRGTTYVDVKGGVGRIAMLLAGYCFLNYTWSCPQFTRDRWRKYH